MFAWKILRFLAPPRQKEWQWIWYDTPWYPHASAMVGTLSNFWVTRNLSCQRRYLSDSNADPTCLTAEDLSKNLNWVVDAEEECWKLFSGVLGCDYYWAATRRYTNCRESEHTESRPERPHPVQLCFLRSTRYLFCIMKTTSSVNTIQIPINFNCTANGRAILSHGSSRYSWGDRTLGHRPHWRIFRLQRASDSSPF